MIVSKEEILKILKEVHDPELKRDVVSLGMVKSVEIEGLNIFVHLSVTAGTEAVHQSIKQQIQEKIFEKTGIKTTTVQITKGTARSSAFSAKMPLPGIKQIIAVSSGKGGVGKTTVSVNLAVALARMNVKVGLMDGDIYGPNVPLMLGISAERRPYVNENEKIIPLEAHGIKMISMGVLIPPDQPMVWRGPMLHSAVTQFLQKVEWGELDFLIVDLPPGTGDVQLSLVQTVPLSGAVMVTTPQEVALMDVRKGIALFQKTNVPLLGILENMSGSVFGAGGAMKVAQQFKIPLLGEIPLESKVREGGDAGIPITVALPETPAAKCFMKAAESIMELLQDAALKG